MNDSVKKGLAKYASKQMVKILVKKAPALGWGPIGWIVSEVVYRLALKFLDATILGFQLLIIDLDVRRDVQKMEKILDKIRSLGGNATEEQKKRLDDELAKEGIDLIRFNL